MGLSLAGVALGMMVMPQVITLLLDFYGFRGAIILLGGFALHSFVGSLLLQPAKWHYIPEKIDGNFKQEMETIEEDHEEDDEIAEAENLITNNDAPKTSEEIKPTKMRRKSTVPRSISLMDKAVKRKSMTSLKNSYSLMDFTGSSIQLHIDDEEFFDKPNPSDRRKIAPYPGVEFSSQTKIIEEVQKQQLELKKKHKKSFWQKNCTSNGFRPTQGSNLPEFIVRSLNVLRSRTELQDGYTFLFSINWI